MVHVLDEWRHDPLDSFGLAWVKRAGAGCRSLAGRRLP
jgi:hypothetical protein